MPSKDKGKSKVKAPASKAAAKPAPKEKKGKSKESVAKNAKSKQAPPRASASKEKRGKSADKKASTPTKEKEVKKDGKKDAGKKAPATARPKATFQPTTFEKVQEKSFDNTQGLNIDMEEMLRQEEEALYRTNLKDKLKEEAEEAKQKVADALKLGTCESPAKPVTPLSGKCVKKNGKGGEEVVFVSTRNNAYVPEAFDPFDPRFLNKDSVLKVDKEKIIWKDGDTQVKLTLTNSSKQKRAFKMRCSDNSYFRMDPVYGCVEPKKTANVVVTLAKALPVLQKIKVESIGVNDGDSRDAREILRVVEPSALQYTHIEVHPPATSKPPPISPVTAPSPGGLDLLPKARISNDKSG